MLRSALLLVLTLLVGLPAPASAQRGLDIERFRPALDEGGFLGIQGTRPPPSLHATFGLALIYASSPLLVRRDDGAELDVISHRLTGDLYAQLGLGGRFAIAIDVPVVLYQEGAPGPLRDGGPSIASQAFGDPRFWLRYRLLGEASDANAQGVGGTGIAIAATATAPIGDRTAFIGERGVTADLQLLGDFQAFGAGIGVMLGGRHRFETVDVLGVRFRDELMAGIALKMPIPVTTDFLAIAELRAATDAASPFDGPRSSVEGDLALRLIRSDLAFTAGVGTGFTDGVGTPAVRALGTVAWAPRTHDLDGDGVPDADDQCDGLPEDFDGVEDGDGCDDPDNDNDFVFDSDDVCPNEAAEEGRDEDEDGCTDPIVDGDGDGIVDAEDACPAAQEDADGHQDGDGCPELDNDSDGVPDANDTCPTELEDVDGNEDADGCPDPDDDADGVLDASDRCPRVAEDRDQFEDDDGCADPDNDHDGVLDANDRCPAEAERINGVRDDDGCNDTGGRARVRVRGEGPSEVLEGSIRVVGPGVQSAADVDQLVLHLRARAPAPLELAVSTCVRDVPDESAACLAVLRGVLTERGVDNVTLRADPVGRDRFRVTRVVPAPSSDAAPTQPTPPPAPSPSN